MILSDQAEVPTLPPNIRHRHFTLREFNQLSSEKLGFRVDVVAPRKLCDFKPAYGLIFKEYLGDCDYWGYGDLDLLIGDLDSHLGPPLRTGCDVLSLYRDFLSGPLCIYRNTEDTLNLFREVAGYREILQSPFHFAVDENNIRRMPKLREFSSPASRLHYIREVWKNRRELLLRPAGFRYHYQWFLKRRVCSRHPPHDMTDVVAGLTGQGKLAALYRELLYSGRSFRRAGIRNWTLEWRKGELKLLGTNTGIPAFHFIGLKKGLNYRGSPEEGVPDTFRLDLDGFHL